MGIGSAIASIGSAVIGASSASKAAGAQTDAANRDLALKERIYDETTQRFQPFLDEGRQYAEVRNFLDGIGPRPTFGGTAPAINTISTPGTTASPFGGSQIISGAGEGAVFAPAPTSTPGTTQYQVGDQTFGTLEDAQAWANAHRTGGTPFEGFQATPGYQFAVDQGRDAIDASAAARGGLYSGKTLQDLQTFGQGMANQEFNNYYNRIAGGAAGGQAAAAQQSQAGQNFSVGAGNALANIGNAQSAGAIGVGNALQSGINNGLGLFQYQQNLNAGGGPQQANIFSAPWASSGFFG